jgi:uncharacterized protein (DUF427 family)
VEGPARYFDVAAGDMAAKRAARAYDDPSPRFRALAGYVVFYAGQMEACFVGIERVLPQPGDSMAAG